MYNVDYEPARAVLPENSIRADSRGYCQVEPILARLDVRPRKKTPEYRQGAYPAFPMTSAERSAMAEKVSVPLAHPPETTVGAPTTKRFS